MPLQIYTRDSQSRNESWIGLDDLARRLKGLVTGKRPAPSATAATERLRPESVRGIGEALRIPGSVLVVQAGGSVRAVAPAAGCVLGWDADGKPCAVPLPSAQAPAGTPLAPSPIVWWRPPGDGPRRPAVVLPDRVARGRELRHDEVLLLVLLDSRCPLLNGVDDVGVRQAGRVRTTLARQGNDPGEFRSEP